MSFASAATLSGCSLLVSALVLESDRGRGESVSAAGVAGFDAGDAIGVFLPNPLILKPL